MSRRYADFSRPAPTPWTWIDTFYVGFGSFIAVCAFAVLVLLFLMTGAHARDNGQWEQSDPQIREWYRTLMQPDKPYISCCGEGDLWWADKVNVRGGKVYATVTDDRPDEPLGRRHIPVGTEYEIPPHKIKFDKGNPTGHVLIFINGADQVLCFVQNGGV